MKRFLVMILAVLSMQGLYADSQEDNENSCSTATSTCTTVVSSGTISNDETVTSSEAVANDEVIGTTDVVATCEPVANCDLDSCCMDDCSSWNFCDSGFYLAVDWLYWKARRCDLDLGLYNGISQLSSLNNAVATVTFPGDVVSIHHNYHSGVRVAIGMESISGFGFGIEYVYFNPTEKRRASSPLVGSSNLTISRVPGLLNSSFTGIVTDVRGAHNLQLNQVDILFSYQFDNISSTEVQSFLGVRLGWIEDTLATRYNGNGFLGIFEYNLREKNELSAYGLIVGSEVFQDLWCSFGLYLKAGLGILYGSYDQHSSTNFRSSVLIPGTVPQSAVGYDVRDDSSCLISTLDLAVGLGFEGCDFCFATWSLIVGYEFHSWFGYRDYLRPVYIGETTGTVGPPNTLNGNSVSVLTRNKSDLGFDGLFVRLAVQF